jgi:hypothetical protein
MKTNYSMIGKNYDSTCHQILVIWIQELKQFSGNWREVIENNLYLTNFAYSWCPYSIIETLMG